MMITYTLNESEIRTAIKEFCQQWLRNDQVIDICDVHLNYEVNEIHQTKIFSATATPTKFNPQR